MRRKLIDLKQQRSTLLEGAEALLKEGKREEYRAEMEKISNMNADIKDLEDLVREQDRKFMEKAPDLAEERDKAEERGNQLMKGLEVKFSSLEVAKALFVPKHVEKSVTLATGTLAQPTGAGSNIRDALGYGVGAIIDQVYVQDLTGMGSFMMMGLFGLIIAMIVNIFLQSSAMTFVISALGVVIFTGLTAYDTQKIRAFGENAPLDDATAIRRGALLGALTLYLDFINLFLMLLRLMGDRR